MPPSLLRSVLAVSLAGSAFVAFSPCRASETVSEDINIRNRDPKNLPFDKIIRVSTDYTDKILYDRAIEGDMCFITCNNYNGVTSKWTNFYVDLQPFENFCMFLTGCSSQYPLPSSEVRLKVGQGTWALKMIDPASNRYYLPLDARQAIKAKPEEISLEIAGVKMPVYRIGTKNTRLLVDVVDAQVEKNYYANNGPGKTKEERLVELKDLLGKGLISPEEYSGARRQIIEGN
jgi:hypothetical protein